MLQLANHCKIALSNETLLLLHPLGNFSYINIAISTKKSVNVHVYIKFL